RLVKRRAGRAYARERLARERAQLRERRIQVAGRGPRGVEHARQLRYGGLERAAVGSERAREDAEVVHEVPELDLVAVEPAHDLVEVDDQPREVVGARPEQRLVDLGGVLVRAARGAVVLVQALGAAVVLERGAELVQRRLQVGADGRLQRRQHL